MQIGRCTRLGLTCLISLRLRVCTRRGWSLAYGRRISMRKKVLAGLEAARTSPMFKTKFLDTRTKSSLRSIWKVIWITTMLSCWITMELEKASTFITLLVLHMNSKQALTMKSGLHMPCLIPIHVCKSICKNSGKMKSIHHFCEWISCVIRLVSHLCHC